MSSQNAKSGGAWRPSGGALAPAPARPTAVATARNATTISKYIARFRYEQPLPREKRTGVQKEDFWWKRGGSSPTAAHRRSRLHQQQPQHQFVSELDGDSTVEASSVSGSSSAQGSSVTSGYERYIPELHHEHEAFDTPPAAVLPGRDQRPVVATGSGASGGSADAALLLSSLSASWDSVPSHLEAPSSSVSHESILHEHVEKHHPSRQWEHESHAADRRSGLCTASYEAANVMAQEEEQEEAKVENAELVIERVRKRLGWSSSDSGGSERSLSFQYDVPSPPPPHAMQWRRPQGFADDDAFPPFSVEASPARSNGGDDEILSGTMRRAGDEPVVDKSLELVLSELSSSSEVLRRDSHDQQSRLGASESLTTFDAMGFYPAPRSRDIDTNEEEKPTKPPSQDAHQSSSPRVSLADDAEAAATNQVPDFAPSDVRDDEINQRYEDGVTQMEPPVLHAQARRDTAGETVDSARIAAGVSRIPAVDEREDSSVEKDATPFPSAERAEEDQRESKAVEVPLQSAASPVLPPWRRSSSSASPSSPRDDFAPLSFPRPSTSPTSLSSQSSVTAETAKTLDGLVSLVVQSWSSDFFFGGADHGDSKDLTVESLDRNPAESEEEATEGTHVLVAQDKLENVSNPHEGNGTADSIESLEEAPGGSPVILSQENSPPVETGAVIAAAVDDKSAPVGLLEVNATQEEEGEHEDDEIVQLLLARIALYEQALRRLDQETKQQEEEVGDNPA